MITEKVLDVLKRFSLVKKGDVVTVALSGGADSMALLYVLLELREELGITVRAAHYNHGIRGEEADRDEAFVRKTCDKLNVPFICSKGDVPKYASENKMSMELAARALRYDFLSGIDGVIATAHHADDNLETVLLNLSRGTALTGLCGIPVKRGCFIRPLISCSREEIEKYCSLKEIEYVTDSTNFSDEYTRNRIRHRVIPVLKEINPSVEAAAFRATSSLAEDSDYLKNEASKELAKRRVKRNELSVEGFLELHPAIAKRVLIMFCRDALTEELLLDSCHLAGVYDIALRGGRCGLSRGVIARSFKNIFTLVSSTESKNVVYSIEFSEEKMEKGVKIHNLLLKNAIDCDKIEGKLIIRTRAAGDKIRLPRRGGTKTLKKLFTEYAVPLGERDKLPVLSDDRGVVWVCGFGTAERCAVDAQTTKILKINVIKED